jgi:hypothetical protein
LCRVLAALLASLAIVILFSAEGAAWLVAASSDGCSCARSASFI